MCSAMADVACPFVVVWSLSLVPNVLAVWPTYFPLQFSHVISYTTSHCCSFLFLSFCSSVCCRLGGRGIWKSFVVLLTVPLCMGVQPDVSWSCFLHFLCWCFLVHPCFSSWGSWTSTFPWRWQQDARRKFGNNFFVFFQDSVSRKTIFLLWILNPITYFLVLIICSYHLTLVEWSIAVYNLYVKLAWKETCMCKAGRLVPQNYLSGDIRCQVLLQHVIVCVWSWPSLGVDPVCEQT